MRVILPNEQTTAPLKRKACFACRARKVKCDRNLPCKTCISWNLQCRYPESRRTCRRKTAPAPSSTHTSGNDLLHSNVDNRVRGIESLLHTAEAVTDSFLPLDDTRTPNGDESVQERLDRIEARLHTLIHERTAGKNKQPAFQCQPYQGTATSRCYTLLQASTATLQQCWSTFRQNVDPLVKILHLPTAWLLMSKATEDLASLKDGQLSMVFAIMGACMSSQPDAVVERQFKMTKRTTIATFMGAADHALSKTNLTISEDLVTLQAFVLCLSMQRFSGDARQVWALTGLARRLGQSAASASPFEREMRRRLLCELWTLDRRACIDRGQPRESSQLAEMPELPSNILDKDLHPHMTEMPTSHAGWTEVSFALIQTQTALADTDVEASVSVKEKLKIIDAYERKIQGKYTRYCDGSNPVHWLAQHVATVHLLELRLKAVGQRHPAADEDALREDLFSAALDVLDIPKRLNNEPEASQWLWLLEAYMQFVPLRFVLDELCYREPGDTEYAWSVVNMAWSRWSEAKAGKENFEMCHKLKRRAEELRTAALVKSMSLWDSTYSSDESVDSTPYLDLLGEKGGDLSFGLNGEMDADPCNLDW